MKKLSPKPANIRRFNRRKYYLREHGIGRHKAIELAKDLRIVVGENARVIKFAGSYAVYATQQIGK